MRLKTTIKIKNKYMKQVLETLEQPYETYEQALSRRGSAMAGIIGTLQGRLDILNTEIKFELEYDNMSPKEFKSRLKSIRTDIIKTLIVSTKAWAEMQRYEDGDIGKEMSDRKLADLTTELEVLKTLAL
jgi:hypothetical protein